MKELEKEEVTEEVVSFKEKLRKVENLIKEEKALRTQIKKEAEKLHVLTKKTIETLSDEQVYMLLEKKWIETLVLKVKKLLDTIVDELVRKIQKLHGKYATTYFEVEKQIEETKQQLCSMMDKLEGNEFDMKGLSGFKALLMGE